MFHAHLQIVQSAQWKQPIRVRRMNTESKEMSCMKIILEGWITINVAQRKFDIEKPIKVIKLLTTRAKPLKLNYTEIISTLFIINTRNNFRSVQPICFIFT